MHNNVRHDRSHALIVYLLKGVVKRMEALSLEKQACLWHFSLLLNYYNRNFVPPNEAYDNQPPSSGIEKRLMRTVFFDTMLDLVPHARAGLIHEPIKQDVMKFLLMSIIGRMWPPSPHRFTSEHDYIATMRSVDFQCVPTVQSARQTLNALLDDYVGYGLVTQQSHPCGKQHFREIATPDWVGHFTNETYSRV